MTTMCPECNHQLSEQATACPGCGHPQHGPFSMKVLRVIGTIVLVVIAIVLLVGAIFAGLQHLDS